MNKAIVVKSTGSNYVVKFNNEFLDCKIKGNFRIKDIKTTNPVAVGDWVDIQKAENNKFWYITKIYDRKNYIIRKSINLSFQAQVIAANIDHAFLLVTLKQPETHTTFIDRFLVSSEAYEIPTSLIFNKIDLYTENDFAYLQELKTMYEKIGYKCYETSVVNKTNIEQIRELLKDKVTVISGNSGVGKSSLINAIDEKLNLKTNDISSYHQKGKHTTTFAEMFDVSSGGMIIDTPGIKGFGVIDIANENIANYFPEMLNLLSNCQFYNCTHIHEPNCAVRNAVDSGEICVSRFNSYISILTEEKGKYR